MKPEAIQWTNCWPVHSVSTLHLHRLWLRLSTHLILNNWNKDWNAPLFRTMPACWWSHWSCSHLWLSAMSPLPRNQPKPYWMLWAMNELLVLTYLGLCVGTNMSSWYRSSTYMSQGCSKSMIHAIQWKLKPTGESPPFSSSKFYVLQLLLI